METTMLSAALEVRPQAESKGGFKTLLVAPSSSISLKSEKLELLSPQEVTLEEVDARSPLSSSPPGDHSPLDSPVRDYSDGVESREDDDDEVAPTVPPPPYSAAAFKAHPYAKPGPLMDVGPQARAKLKVPRVPFNGKILIIGCGAVAQCVLPLIPRMIDVPMKNITVVDLFDNSDKIREHIKAGVRFAIEKVTKDTMTAVLNKYLKSGDFLLDLAWEIPTIKFLEWCRDHNVMYLNAALEIENPYEVADPKDVQKFTLYHRHQVLEKQIAAWGRNDGPTAIIEHGANPGLVSHFVKQALVHIAEKVLAEKANADPARAMRISAALASKDFPRLSMELGVKVIHISERDTQVTSQPKRVDEFVNTWSPMGFYQEGIAPAELGWGTHERQLPAHAVEHTTGPKHQICLRTRGINTFVRSWVPTNFDSGDIVGMVVRHGEAYTIPQALSVYDEAGNCVYRPTCHYAYMPTDAAISSLNELRMRGYKVQSKTRVLRDDIVEGTDILGCLLMGHDFDSWWIGTILDITEARDLIPHHNATVVQVAVGLTAAMQFAIENPRRGVCVPDDLPYERILASSLPYLGAFLSLPVAWTPLKAAARERSSEYRTHLVEEADKADPWQFTSFLIH